jgi:hypothetical protein
MSASAPLGVQGLPLTAADLANFARCGIPPAMLERAGVFRVDSVEGARIVGRRPGSGDYSGIVFPYFWPGEAHPFEYRLRRDHPDIEVTSDGSREERNKYLSPPGRGSRLYIVRGVLPVDLADVSLPIVISEGEKKTLALTALADTGDRPRWLSIGIPGVWNWRGKVGIEAGPAGERRPVKGVIADFDKITWRGRKVIVLFDRNVRTNPDVQAARWELTRELTRRGANVWWWNWPPSTPPEVNGVDDLTGLWGPEQVLQIWDSCVHPAPQRLSDCNREFEAVSFDHYRLSLPAALITIDIDRLRWERDDLIAEAVVRCDLPGVRSVRGVVAAGKLNLLSLTSRRAFAKELQSRAPLKELDWTSLLEEAALRTIEAERAGVELKLLDNYPDVDEESQFIRVHGLTLLANLATVIYGPGGTAKSYFALWLAGELARRGIAVAYLDTECDWQTHKIRKQKLFGRTQHEIYYYRIRRPLAEETDALRRGLEQRGIRYVILDSISLASSGPLEESATAIALFGALNRIGVGSSLGALLIGHCPKDRDDLFGSVFFQNNARLIYHCARIDEAAGTWILKTRTIKSNLTPKDTIVCFRFIFQPGRVEVHPADPAEIPELADQLPLADRIATILRRRPLTKPEIAESLDASVDSIRRAINRNKHRFVVLPGGRVGLRTKDGEDSTDDHQS